MNIREKSPCVSGQGREKGTVLKYPEHFVLLNKACSQEKLFYQNLTYNLTRRREVPRLATSSHSAPLTGEKHLSSTGEVSSSEAETHHKTEN